MVAVKTQVPARLVSAGSNESPPQEAAARARRPGPSKRMIQCCCEPAPGSSLAPQLAGPGIHGILGGLEINSMEFSIDLDRLDLSPGPEQLIDPFRRRRNFIGTATSIGSFTHS